MNNSSRMYRMKRPMPKPCAACDRAEHDEDEQQTRRVEARHQLAERGERAHAVLADRERHGAERADRREAHDHADDAEQHLRNAIDRSR